MLKPYVKHLDLRTINILALAKHSPFKNIICVHKICMCSLNLRQYSLIHPHFLLPVQSKIIFPDKFSKTILQDHFAGEILFHCIVRLFLNSATLFLLDIHDVFNLFLKKNDKLHTNT